MHHLTIADVKAHVIYAALSATFAGEEQQITGAQLALVDLPTEVTLLSRAARQLKVCHILVYAAHQPTAIHTATVVAAITIRHADKLFGIVAQCAT